jgi:site-specific DNA recombinase
MPPLLGIIYARASKDRKGRSISVLSQIEAGRRFFARHGITEVAVLVDNDLSASRYATHEREDYAEALRLLATGAANLLWTWENSRATRELDVFVVLRRILVSIGGFWAYDERIYDMNLPDDRISTAEDAVESEKESERLRKRVTRGIESRAYSGQHHGAIWWGYRKVYDPRTGEATVEIDPVTGPLAVELVERLLASASESGLAREFEERGIACPQEQKWTAVHVRKLYDASLEETSWARLSAGWMPEQLDAALEVFMLLKARESPSMIARHMNIGEYPHVMPGRWCAAKIRGIALNPARAGLRVHQGEIIGKAAWEGVITPHDYYRLLAKLGDPSRRTVKDGDRVKHLLSGIMKCGTCEAGIGIRHKDWGWAYRCKSGHVIRQQDKTDAYVVECVLRRLERPDALELFRVQVDADQAFRAAMSEAQELRARLDAFTDQAADGGITPERLARIEAKLMPKIEAAQRRIREIGMAPMLAEVVGPQARSVWAGLTIGQRRDVVRAIVRVRLMRMDQRGTVAFDPDAIEVTWLAHGPLVPELAELEMDAAELSETG